MTEKQGKEKSPAFQFYPADLLSDPLVMSMGNEFIGAYIKLLCWDWLDNGIVFNNDDILELVNLKSRGANKEKIIERLRMKFVEHPTKKGFVTNARLMKEREKQQAWREKSAKGGKQSSTNRQPNGNTSSSSSSSSSKKETSKEVTTRNSGKGILEFTTDDLNLAQVMRKEIENDHPDLNIFETVEEWASDVQLVRRMRKKGIPQILELWTWARQQEFWRTVILSPSSLGKNWGQVLLQQQRKPDSNGVDWDEFVKKGDGKK